MALSATLRGRGDIPVLCVCSITRGFSRHCPRVSDIFVTFRAGFVTLGAVSVTFHAVLQRANMALSASLRGRGADAEEQVLSGEIYFSFI